MRISQHFVSQMYIGFVGAMTETRRNIFSEASDVFMTKYKGLRFRSYSYEKLCWSKRIMQPDKIDWQIIELLSKQFETNSRLSELLHVSEGTIRNRVKKLRNAGVIKIRALRNPEVLENQQLAIIAANFKDSRQLDEKAKEILNLEGVISISIVSGQYDLFIEALVDSNKGLITFLTENLAKIGGLARTETFLVLKNYEKWI